MRIVKLRLTLWPTSPPSVTKMRPRVILPWSERFEVAQALLREMQLDRPPRVRLQADGERLGAHMRQGGLGACRDQQRQPRSGPSRDTVTDTFTVDGWSGQRLGQPLRI